MTHELALAQTSIFTMFMKRRIAMFRNSQGFNRWLKEYDDMDARGLFEPVPMQKLYIRMLIGRQPLNFICRCAINYIGCNAMDAATIYARGHTFAIHYLTGGVAEDDMEIPLTGLSLEEAVETCKAMNKEAEEHLFNVFDNTTNKIVKLI